MLHSTMTPGQDAPGIRWLTAAAGSALTPLLRGPRRNGEVVARTTDMVAVHVTGAEPALVCVTNTRAARLPCAMIVDTPLPAATVGTPAAIGNGRLRLPTAVVSVARWWPARAPHVFDAALCVRRAARCPRPDLDELVRQAAALLTDGLSTDRHRLGDAVDALLGLGPGLTPAGDDVLAGALTTLRAVHSRRADELTAAIEAAAPLSRTTTVSAGLLAYAAQGRCVPELAALLAALESPGGDVQSAHRDLLTVGHTSGSALYAGVLCALLRADHPMSDRRPAL
ncbi:DUF2877 domain-containing protein [Phytoactinopolyspora mesophila]|uniref:DUF2877 domain-containing protein n=1 Tax=Phytoactinopolyspora mesophila TaxID=2650750 RepID=A0A7K3LX48_9ACTN|nr:DUF2877 domain-containing protein [Phytoactinopolyspora mesophila]NDL55604.1 DUF2877 domain-containing protein [Phytoactinopolyspora mesophila]